MASTEEGVRTDMVRITTVRAIDAAFAERMKVLFDNFVRHIADPNSARAQFRKDLAVARQVHSEMLAIADEP
jgi:hypothetical protein